MEATMERLFYFEKKNPIENNTKKYNLSADELIRTGGGNRDIQFRWLHSAEPSFLGGAWQVFSWKATRRTVGECSSRV